MRNTNFEPQLSVIVSQRKKKIMFLSNVTKNLITHNCILQYIYSRVTNNRMPKKMLNCRPNGKTFGRTLKSLLDEVEYVYQGQTWEV